MRETTFIKQKRQRWQKFEKIHENKNADPDEITKLFVEITDDLSYARTFYPKRSVRVFLNYLSQLVFLKVNKNKSVGIKQFFKFWTFGLPMEIARSWKQLLIAFIVFFGAMMVGIVTTANDINFATEIMGKRYIEMTNENIDKGDPMAVYHQHGDSYSSTFSLTANNTRVAAYTYTSGFLAGIPPILIMIDNGIMLGTFQYYLYHKNVLGEAIWVIWIHGVLEIWAIIIAGAAGLVLGSGLLFPGTYTRLQSLRISAKRSFKIAISTIFILIISGFIEGSITRYTQMPIFIKYFIVIGSLLFILFYFVAYPFWLYQKNIKNGDFVFEDKIPHSSNEKIELEKTREIGEMYNDTLSVYKSIFSHFFKGALLLFLPVLVGISILHLAANKDSVTEYYLWQNLRLLLTNNIFPFSGYVIGLSVISSLCLCCYYALYLYRKDASFQILEFYKYTIKNVHKLWPILLSFSIFYLISHPIIILFFLLTVPFIFQFSYAGFYDELGYKVNLKNANAIIWKSWFGTIGYFLLLLVIPIILYFTMFTLFGSKGLGVFEMITSYFLQHISPFVNNINPYSNLLNLIIYLGCFSLIFSFLITGLVIQFHTVRERIEAHSLYKRLKNFGLKHNLFEQADEGEF